MKSTNKKKPLVAALAILLITFLVGCAGSRESINIPTSMPETPVSHSNNEAVLADTHIHFIDTGQSDSILIENSGHFALIDTGDVDDRATVTDYLHSLGITRLDYLILTHFHADHIGGAATILNGFEVGATLVPNGDADTKVYRDYILALSDNGLAASVPLEGSVMQLGGATLTFFNTNNPSTNPNNTSLVTLLQSGSRRALFTGDAEAEVEKMLPDVGIVDVFKAGHHGSNTSNSRAFIEATHPGLVVITSGQGNSYGHPSRETMELFESLGIPVYRTDEQGTIIVTLGEEVRVNQSSQASYEPGGHGETMSQKPEAIKPPENFKNCTELREVYPEGVDSSHPAYQRTFDRDNDGWACE